VASGILRIGICPNLSPLIGAVGPFKSLEREGDRAAVPFGQELACSRPVGRNDGFCQKHAFRDGQSEPLGSMKRDVAVASLHESVGVLARQGLIYQVVVGDAFEQVQQFPVLSLVLLGGVDLDDEPGVASERVSFECDAEGFYDCLGILAFLIAVEVVGEAEEELVSWEPQNLAVVALGYAKVDAVGHGQHGDGRLGCYGVAREVRGRPDFVEILEEADPPVREVGQLPGPVGDVSLAAAKGRSVMMVNVCALRRVDME